jgi:hypothetical protein
MTDRRKKNAQRTPVDVAVEYQLAPAQNADEYRGVPALHEALELVQYARDVETRRQGLTMNRLPREIMPLQRLLIAVLESMTPEQRADVRRRLG